MRLSPCAFAPLAALAALVGCQSSPYAETSKSDAGVAASWMTGSFTSAAQAKADPDFKVIDLHMTRLWPDRKDGFWLYVEQAAAETPAQPYRQRVYRLHNEDDGTVHSDVYELPGDPLRFAGAWSDPAKLAGLRPDELLPRDGCTITLRRHGDQFSGGTEGTGCESSLRGASFATSQVTLRDGVLESWDRGWRQDGEQAWGAVKGPYVFVRQPKVASSR